MPPRKTNGAADDHRVLVDREEYAALRAFQEEHAVRVVANDKIQARIHELNTTCGAQARRLAELGLTVEHLERINGIQRVFIDLLRADHPAVASLEDLSTFWRSWFLTTEAVATRDSSRREEISKLEPDLFRSWRIWVRDAGRHSRTFAVAGTTRVEVEAHNAIPQATLQEHVMEQQRAHNVSLVARVRELEAEVEAYRNAAKDKRP